jgi:hypothetical protein
MTALACALPHLAAAPEPARQVGVASALEKLRPRDPLPPASAIDLAAARGECEAAQIAVRPARALTALSASSAPLQGPSRVAPALYRVDVLDLPLPSGPDGEAGPWPDPLVPERDAYFAERRRAFPVAVAPGRLQAIWVEVCVPEAARPGAYRGEVRLTEAGRPLGAVPIALRVWPFALPATSTSTATFGLPTRLGTRALGGPDDRELARALAAAALRHRVSPHGLSYDPPWGRCTASACQLDFAGYDAELSPVLDGTLVPGVRGTFADVRVAARDWEGTEGDLAALFRAWRAHFEARGWADALWLYTLDEPRPSQLAELARRARAAHVGGVRVFATTTPAPALEGLVDAFAPVVNFFEGKSPEAFVAVRPVALAREGARPFWYASCMSHGCDEPAEGGAGRRALEREFGGWPGYEIDRPGAAARVMGWLAFRQRVAGELYYDMLQAWTGDPWKDVRRFAGNGDGTLLYPGIPERLGGSRPFPVESIRLKLVRDGREDLELLQLARRSGLGELADRLSARLAPSLRGYERAPGPYLSAHRELGEAIAAALGQAAAGSGGRDPARPRRGAPRRRRAHLRAAAAARGAASVPHR